MKDLDKIKEKDKKDEFKGILGLGLVFLVALGVIIYILISLTNQYFDLKNQLSESKSDNVEVTLPDEGKTYKYLEENNEIKKIEVKKEPVKQAKLLVDNTTNDNTTKNNILNNNEKNKANIKKPTEKEVITKVHKSKPTKKIQHPKKVTKQVEKEKIKSTKQVQEKKTTKITKHYPYAVQLMAFRNKSDAEKQKINLHKKIKDIYVVKVDLGKKGVWYRLRCCKSKNKKEALKKRNEINKKFNLKSIVVRN
jgi:cell division septation protein DedD